MNNLNVKNSWNGLATQKGLDQTTQKITSAIEKSTGKIAATIKDGTKTISEATRKVANESVNIQTIPVTAVVQGLQGVAVATAEISDYLRRNPTALGEVAESGRSICKQFADLVDHTSNFADGSQRLREVAESAKTATDWIGGKYHGAGNQGITVNNCVGSFNDLFAG